MFSADTLRLLTRLAFITAYLLLSMYVMAMFIRGSNYVVDNTAYGTPPLRPVAYRFLVPTIADYVYELIPESVVIPATSALANFRDSGFGRRMLGLNPGQALPGTISNESIFYTYVKLCVVFLTLLAFVAMLAQLALAMFPQSLAYAYTAPLVALLAIPVFIERFGYTYDFAELFFSCALLYLLYRQRWRTYLACLALATMNKESAGFMLFFYALWFYARLPRREYIRWGVLQLLVFGLVLGGIHYYHRDTPGMYGTAYIFTLPSNLIYLMYYNYYTYVCLVMTVCFLIYRWPEKPDFLKGGLWLLVPSMSAYLFACNPGEYRDLYWCMPVLMLLATHTVIRLGEVEQLAIFRRKIPPQT